MVMKTNIFKKVIAVLIVLVMLSPIVIDMCLNGSLRKIKYAKLENKIEETANNYGFALVYVAPGSLDETKDIKKNIKDDLKEYKNVATDKDLKGYYMDYDKLSDDEKKDIFGSNNAKKAYMFLVNGELLDTIYDELDDAKLKSYIRAYSANGIDDDLVNYKVAKDAKSYQKIVKDKKKTTMAVFGRDTCFYCNQFKVVYNTVAGEYGLDIYYFDSDSYDKDEYTKVMNLGLKIPASCSDTQKEVNLQPGFGTPLTLFTKNGKVVDCISGYATKSSLITKLKTVGILEN